MGFKKIIKNTILIIGLILALLQTAQIIKSLLDSGVSIKATGVFHEIQLPDDIFLEIADKYDNLSKFEIDPKELFCREDAGVGPDESCIDIAAQGARQAIRFAQQLYPIDLNDRLLGFRTLITYTVRNRGTREASDLILDLPVSGLFKIERGDGVTAVEPFNSSIELGNLRPKNSMNVTIWTKNYFSKYQGRETRITYPSGVFRINYPEYAWGATAWCVQYMLPVAMTALCIVIAFFLVIKVK